MSVESIDQLFKEILPTKLKDNPDLVTKINSIFKFDVSGKNWIVDLTQEGGKVEENDGEANCTVTVAESDLLQIVNKTMNAQMAFMMGKLKVSGDMGLALKLGKLFS